MAILKRTRKPPTQSGTEVDEENTEGAGVDALQKIVQKYADGVTSPLTGIRAFCVGCMGGHVKLVNQCPSTKCPLHAFRSGKNTLDRRFGVFKEVNMSPRRTRTKK